MPFPNRVNTRPGTTRRVRIKDYDYSSPGYYFVTICTHKRHQYFGTITRDVLSHSPAGIMINHTIVDCESQVSNVSIDSSVVMPNHVHVLIGLSVRLEDEPESRSLIDVVHWLKSTTHRRYRDGVNHLGWKQFDEKVWQEGYHDHIVRNDRELEEIRAYVSTNVDRWEKDTFHDGFVDWR